MTKCEKCPAEVRFVQMIKKDGTKGARGILDVLRSEKGNIRITTDARGNFEGRVLTGYALQIAQTNGEPLYLSHFVTCPAAESFRRGT